MICYQLVILKKVKENPYRLARDIVGIGFKYADQIAQKLGYSLTSKERISAGIEYVFHELSANGHTCYLKEKFLEEAKRILEVEENLIEDSIKDLIALKVIEEENIDNFCFLFYETFYFYEKRIVNELNRIKDSFQSFY